MALPRRPPVLVRQPRRGAGRRSRGGAVDRAAQPGGPRRAHATPRRAQRGPRDGLARRRCSATRPSTPSARPTSCAPSCATPQPPRSAQSVIRHDHRARQRRRSTSCSTSSSAPAASTSPATSARRSQRRIAKRMDDARAARLRRLHRLPRGPPRRVRGALQHDPHQRHRASSATRRPGTHLATDVVPQHRSRQAAAGRADPRVERRLRRRARRPTRSPWCFAEALGRRAVPRPREDLRHRRRRRGARQARHGAYAGTERRGRARATASSGTSSATRAALHVPRDLRRCVIFGRHDLVQDAPISRLDLLVCRNTLMYFNAETQSRILRPVPLRARRRRAASFLGKAEMLLTHADLFRPSDLKRRIFPKVADPTMRDRVRASADGLRRRPRQRPGRRRCSRGRVRPRAQRAGRRRPGRRPRRWPTTARRRHASASRQRTSAAPFQDLELSYRPVELRARIERIADATAQPSAMRGR